MMLGLTGATLAGVPLATWIGQTFGWRAAFVLVGVIGVVTCALISRCVPSVAPVKGASAARELSALGRKQVWLTLGVGSVGFGGLFCVLSYIAPTLTQVSGLPERYVPLVLAVFGVGMILGNLVGSWLADRSLMRTIGGVLMWNVVVLCLFSVAAASAYGCRRRCTDTGGGLESFRLQHSQCAGGVVGRRCHRRRLGMGFHRMGGSAIGRWRPGHLRMVIEGGAEATWRPRAMRRVTWRKPRGLGL
jgi:MFS family permease